MESVHAELKKFERFTDKGRKKIAEICTIAARVFSDKGYLAATLGDVANAAGMTKGGIFHYFSTKEELLFLILYRYVDSTLRELKKKLDASNSPHDKLQIFLKHHIGNYRDNVAESRLILRERGNLPTNYSEIIKGRERVSYVF